MKKKIVLKYDSRYSDTPYKVMKCVNTIEYKVGERLSEKVVKEILGEKPPRFEVEIT